MKRYAKPRPLPKLKELTGYDIMFSGKESEPSKQTKQGYGGSVKDLLGSKVSYIPDVGEIRLDDVRGGK